MAGLFHHQPAVGLLDGRAVVDHPVDLARDRHRDAALVGELHDDAGCFDALGNLVHRGDDLVDRLAGAELLTDVAVAAALAGAGDDQIAHARQPGEGVPVPAERFTHLGHLPHRTGHHHRSRVLPDAQRIAHAHGDRVHVLQRAGHLDADDVVGGVGPEPFGAEQPAEVSGQMGIGHGQHRRCGVTLGDLTGDVGPGQDSGRVTGQHLVDDLAHPVVGALLEALDQRHHRHPRAQFAGQLGQHVAESVGRHPHDDDVGAFGGFGEVGGGAQGVRQFDLVAEVLRIAVVLVDVVGGLLRAHPLQRRAAPGADGGHGGAPGSAPEDDDFGFALCRCHGDQIRTARAHRGWLSPCRCECAGNA